MTLQSIDHLNISVANLEASTAFYAALFGFSAVEHGTYEGTPWVILRSGDSMLCMYEHPERAAPEEASEVHHRVNHVGFRIDDGAAFEQLLRSKNVAIEYETSFRRPHSRSWYLRDPSGHKIEVTEWDEGRISFEGLE